KKESGCDRPKASHGFLACSDCNSNQRPLPTCGAAAASRTSLQPCDYWTLWKVYEARVNPASALASTTRKRLCALRRYGYFKLCYGLRDNLKVPRIPLSSSARAEFDFLW